MGPALNCSDAQLIKSAFEPGRFCVLAVKVHAKLPAEFCVQVVELRARSVQVRNNGRLSTFFCSGEKQCRYRKKNSVKCKNALPAKEIRTHFNGRLALEALIVTPPEYSGLFR